MIVFVFARQCTKFHHMEHKITQTDIRQTYGQTHRIMFWVDRYNKSWVYFKPLKPLNLLTHLRILYHKYCRLQKIVFSGSATLSCFGFILFACNKSIYDLPILRKSRTKLALLKCQPLEKITYLLLFILKRKSVTCDLIHFRICGGESPMEDRWKYLWIFFSPSFHFCCPALLRYKCFYLFYAHRTALLYIQYETNILFEIIHK